MNNIATALLEFAHELFGPGFWPGDWVWATMTAGALIGLLPVLGTGLVALIRKGTGNRYDAPMMAVIGVIGVVTVLVLPWLLFTGISESYRTLHMPGSVAAANLPQLNSIFESYAVIGQQIEYLGGGPNVYEIIFYPSGQGLRYAYYLAMLIGLPALSLLFVMIQARLALRRGPKWPGRFFWIPLVLLVVFSVTVSANTAVHLWLGFTMVSALGILPIALLGSPSWSTVQRSGGDRDKDRSRSSKDPADSRQDAVEDSAARQVPPRSPSGRDQPSSARDAAPPARSGPTPQRGQDGYRPTAVAAGPEPADQLAATPGPVPVPGSGQQSGTRQAESQQNGGSRFQRIRQLGSGGFATVWEAVDTQLGRTVALKIAHSLDRETEQRMEREARALAALNHPNCVRVYDIVEESDGVALVMEYLQGRPLSGTVDSAGPLSEVHAGRLWATTASAINAAHDQGVLHRDVKPSNVVLDPHGVPHLIDFGIARAKGDATLTASGMVIGTPDYTAPETAEGAPASPASDAWQLAATVSFALSGYPPRGTRESPMAALMAAARGEAPNYLPRQSVHSKLLIASLDPQPRNRPTLRAVCKEVEGWLGRTGERVDGPVTSVVPRVR